MVVGGSLLAAETDFPEKTFQQNVVLNQSVLPYRGQYSGKIKKKIFANIQSEVGNFLIWWLYVLKKGR